uniref:Uncharacterized protein n=1 Tax=Lutzomyia longipalpis TaxID=7200 RepID=A0A1B0C9S4_LUTLO
MDTKSCTMDRNCFCYVCRMFIVSKQKCTITYATEKAYKAYFQFSMNNRDKSWAPNVISRLSGNGHKANEKIFIWRSNDLERTNFRGIGKTKRQKFEYPQVTTVSYPIPHDQDIPRPVYRDEDDEESKLMELNVSMSNDDDYVCEPEPKVRRYTQDELNDEVRDFALSKKESQLFASRMKERGFVDSSVKITSFKTRHQKYQDLFTTQDEFTYCLDVHKLVERMELQNYDPEEWRLFIDSSIFSLKCVLLHKGNKYGSIPIG